jgi:protein phosphatase
MFAKETLASDERAVEAGQHSEPAQHTTSAKTVGYYEPHQMAKLAMSGRLYVIADSVGPASGQIAAEYAVKKILHSFYNNENPDLEARLLAVIQEANHDIFERNREHPLRRVMAATVMAALIHDNKLLVASLGDSRVYVVWDEDVEQLNSPLKKNEGQQNGPTGPALLAEKASTPAEKPTTAVSFYERMPKALGLEEQIKIETFSRRLFAGDVVVMCSGSLSGYVTEQEIARAITKHAPDQAIRRLVALAGERGNRSHISLSITRVLSSPVAMRSPLPMIMPTMPSWGEWEKAPKPSQPGGDKVATRPMSKPIPPVPPMTGPMMSRPPSTEIPLTPSRWGWRTLLIGIALLIVLCALPVLAWRFIVPPGTFASVPILGQMEAAMANRVEELGLDLSATQVAESESTADGSQPESDGQSAALPPVAAPVESNSPLATPTVIAEAAAVIATVEAGSAATDTLVIPTPTASPTPAPTIVLPANCENKARFVDDVTVEDGEQFGLGQGFDKIWRIRNEGTCPWGPGFTLRFESGDSLGVSNSVPLLEVAEPDSNADLTVPMRAPDEAGDYRSVWQLYDLAGEPFGPTMYLEIEAVAGVVSTTGSGSSGQAETLFDFVANAPQATWSSGQVSYTLEAARVSETLALPDSGGLVALGTSQLRGNVESDGEVLLTYPHQDLGFIQGSYIVDTPLQPGDALAVTLGFPKLSILSDDGVTFEVSFTPDNGSQVIAVFSQLVDYRDSPISQTFPLPDDIEPGQTGTFTLRVLSGDSTSRDWAVWIEARLVRP